MINRAIKTLLAAVCTLLLGCDQRLVKTVQLESKNNLVESVESINASFEHIEELFQKRIKAEQDYHANWMSNYMEHGFVIRKTSGEFFVRIPEGWDLVGTNGQVKPRTLETTLKTITVSNLDTNGSWIISTGNKEF